MMMAALGCCIPDGLQIIFGSSEVNKTMCGLISIPANGSALIGDILCLNIGQFQGTDYRKVEEEQ